MCDETGDNYSLDAMPFELAPGGPVRIDPENQRTWKTMRLGRIVEGGQFDVVWSSEKPIRPEPYPSSRSTPLGMNFLLGCTKTGVAIGRVNARQSKEARAVIPGPPSA